MKKSTQQLLMWALVGYGGWWWFMKRRPAMIAAAAPAPNMYETTPDSWT